MTPNSYGKDTAYASSRLLGSIIGYNGQPHYVKDSNEKDFYLSHTLTGEEVKVPFDQLDLSNPELGYVNYDSISCYVMRRPLRKYLQGLTPYNTVFHLKDGHTLPPKFSTVPFLSMWKNHYPSLDKICEKTYNLEMEIGGVSRHFALSRGYSVSNFTLHYKNREVGTYKTTTGMFTPLRPCFERLQQTVEETLHA